MFRAILASSLIALSQWAAADIPPPPGGWGDIEFGAAYSGAAAESKWNSIQGPILFGGGTGWGDIVSYNYKVESATDELSRTICERTTVKPRSGGKATESFECHTETSTNGQPLPKFVPVVRMG